MGTLRALVEAGHDVAVVVSRADRRRGRGGAVVPSPVKAAALDLGLPVTDRVDDVIDAGADLGVVVAFGRIIKPHVLEAVPMLNVHFSRLPRWRGAAPVERAILAGDRVTAVDIMAVEEGLDTGPVYSSVPYEIGPEETADELRAALARLGTAELVRLLDEGLPEPRPQVGEPTYAAKVQPHEHRLDWSQPAEHLHRVVRLGRAWTTFRGRRLLVPRARLAADRTDLAPGEIDPHTLEVGTGGGGALALVEVQPEGRPVQPATAWRHGARLHPGERLG